MIIDITNIIKYSIYRFKSLIDGYILFNLFTSRKDFKTCWMGKKHYTNIDYTDFSKYNNKCFSFGPALCSGKCGITFLNIGIGVYIN